MELGDVSPQYQISSSLLAMRDYCPRKAFYIHRMKLIPRRVPIAHALKLGEFFHALMGEYYGIGTNAPGSSDHLFAVEQQVATTLYKPTESLLLEQSMKDTTGRYDGDCEKMRRAWEVARCLFRIFVQKYPFEFDKYEVLSVEQPVRLPLVDLYEEAPKQSELCGTADLIVAKKDDNRAWLVDHKTCSGNPQYQIIGRMWSYQTRIYRILAERYTPPGFTVQGIIYNFISKPTIKFTHRTDKTFEDYVARVRDKWFPRQSYVPHTSSAIIWDEPALPPHLLDTLLSCAEWGAEDVSLRYEQLESHSPRRCQGGYRGCPECAYHELCEVPDPRRWKPILNDRYELRPEGRYDDALLLGEED